MNALKNIATSNPTAIDIFDVLSKRQRSRKRLDLRTFEYELLNKGKHIVHEQFIETFKMLQEAGAGAIVRQRDQPLRFIWNMNLKKAASEALTNVNLIEHKQRTDVKPREQKKRGRKIGSKNKLTKSKSNLKVVPKLDELTLNEAMIARVVSAVLTAMKG